ncbi:restriction endonuclease subunit S, partial [Klebsiella pneumoniae]|uniref:restriction endonuclease subunit S n=1 Tax=Klebsiella pneumoniae TaxID=573 RepID=UPI002747F6AE|nr:restriction endonuclease subunit S [Klebsiella pneumoniae]
HTTGTTVLHLAKNAVPEYPLALPSKALIDAYAGQATPLFALINEKVQESRSLESLRDTLLPKLLSGELSMPSTIDQLVAEPQ